jgi:putative transcription factor
MIGGAKLTVCNECSRYGTPIKITKPSQQISTSARSRTPIVTANKPTKVVQSKIKNEIFNEDVKVVDDYASLIKSARERLGWTQDFLASQLGEKVSFIKKIESGAIVPNIQLAKKLEKILGIPLLEKIPTTVNLKQESEPMNLTLGDIAKLKTSKNK